MTLTFGPEGPKSLFSDPPYPETRYKVSEDQQRRTLDPLSAAVFLTNSVNADNAKPCAATAPVGSDGIAADSGVASGGGTVVGTAM